MCAIIRHVYYLRPKGTIKTIIIISLHLYYCNRLINDYYMYLYTGIIFIPVYFYYCCLVYSANLNNTNRSRSKINDCHISCWFIVDLVPIYDSHLVLNQFGGPINVQVFYLAYIYIVVVNDDLKYKRQKKGDVNHVWRPNTKLVSLPTTCFFCTCLQFKGLT